MAAVRYSWVRGMFHVEEGKAVRHGDRELQAAGAPVAGHGTTDHELRSSFLSRARMVAVGRNRAKVSA